MRVSNWGSKSKQFARTDLNESDLTLCGEKISLLPYHVTMRKTQIKLCAREKTNEEKAADRRKSNGC